MRELNYTRIIIEVPKDKVFKMVDGVFTLVDKQPDRPVTERIKTLTDALNELGDAHPLVEQYSQCCNIKAGAAITFSELCVITAALNEGWKPNFQNPKENKYFITCHFDGTDADDIECGLNLKGHTYRLGFNVVAMRSMTEAPACLLFKSRELALYAAKQFADTYATFLTHGMMTA